MKYVALLRGINVGGNNKVEMSKLKKVFKDLGYENVLTYINSGNVIFDADKTDVSVIERALKKNFKFDIKVVVRDLKNIQKLCKAIPKEWVNDPEQKTDVLFLWEEYDNKKSLDLININKDVDNLLYVSGAIVWNVQRKDYKKSGMNKLIGTPVYKHMTSRNVNTTRKLLELVGK
ncbi:MAG: DUF1697 domain-containing protein [Candidatus Pacebacteria bacterium]|jgi:uncharacterized protein (DUF1697 family)|nr:DUF1697 domain-containing protein [Candidatus Paceibacterota bacterium]